MFAKQCPCCGKKATLNQLGRRSVNQKPRWYQFSRTVQVCPHCAAPIKLGGKAFWWLLLVLPSFISIIFSLFTGYDFLEELKLESYGWSLALIGMAGVYMFSVLEKTDG